ncbi:MAG: thiamine phosphate synthase, partial [Verrucomicrobia bacterium]|nr:thiamine phosphate synthase [Verrucomicrobiota bacterium]
TIYPITKSSGVHLVINDNLEVATQLPEAFVHLGQEDFFATGSRHISDLSIQNKPNQFRLGLSTHAPKQALRAIKAEADYVAIGPVFATPTKPTANPVTLEYVKWAAKNVRIPWFCIGGINLSNLSEVLDAGAQRVCVVSAFLNATDVAKECAIYRKKLDAYFG